MIRFPPPFLLLPRVFMEDRQERDLPIGVGYFTKRTYRLHAIAAEDLADLKSDAAHYAGGHVDQAPSGVVASAAATLRKLKDA